MKTVLQEIQVIHKKNLKFFKEKIPELYKKIVSFSIPETEKAKTGLPTLKKNGRYVHSVYDPVHESENIFKNSGYRNQKNVIFLGIGAGYPLLPFLSIEEKKRLLIVEEKPEFLNLSFKIVDYERLFSIHDCVIKTGDEVPDFSQLLNKEEPSEIFVFEHPVLTKDNDFYNKTKNAFRLFLKNLSAEFNTTGYFSFCWFKNSILNLTKVPQSFDLLSIKETFKGYPAAIVSAGPSLERSIDLLKSIKEKNIVIISASSSFNRLIKANITPHFVVTTDGGFYSSWNTRNGINDNRIILTGDLSTHHDFIPIKHHRYCFFDFGLNFSEIFIDTKNLLPKFTMGGTVTSSCLELAVFLGCNRLILFGQDFGFPWQTAHCRGTIHEKWGLITSNRTEPFETLETKRVFSESLHIEEDYNNQKVKTSSKHLLYRDWFSKKWKGTYTASKYSIKTDGIIYGIPDLSNFNGKDPFEIINKNLKPLNFTGIRKDAMKNILSFKDAIENSKNIEELFQRIDPEISYSIRQALLLEIKRSNGILTNELKSRLKRCLRILMSVLNFFNRDSIRD